MTGRAFEEESRVEFRAARQRHAGIESAIHALMAGNGLDRCRDRGEAGYERYVALAVLGRNLHTLGRLVLKKSRRKRYLPGPFACPTLAYHRTHRTDRPTPISRLRPAGTRSALMRLHSSLCLATLMSPTVGRSAALPPL